jgi:hypothetical protein
VSEKLHGRLRVVTELAGKYRRWLWGLATAVALYALLGFFLAPWLVQNTAITSVRENLDAELRIGKVAINPFVLSLRIEGLELDDPSAARVARIDEIFVNFQASSLFRWAWTFDEIRFTAPQLNLARDAAGTLNLAAFRKQPAVPAAAADPEQGEGSMPRLLIFDFMIAAAMMDWRDEVPADPVETRFGPIDIRIHELNTLPDRSGDQAVVITTETAGTLSWTGSLQINPPKSAGHAAIRGSHFPLASAYVRHEIGFDMVSGNADVDFDYSVDLMPDAGLRAVVDNFSFVFRDLLVRTFTPNAAHTDRDVLALPAMTLSGGTLRWPEQTVSVTSLAIDDAVVNVHRDASGALNFVRNARLEPEPATGTEAAVAAQPVPDDVSMAQTSEVPAGRPWQLSLEKFTVNRLAIALEDESVEPVANIGIQSLDLAVDNISNDAGARFPTALSVTFPSGGAASLNGELAVLPAPLFGFDAVVDDAALLALHPYLKPLADVNLDSGTLDINGRLSHDAEEPLAFAGNLDIDNFLITETDQGSRLGSWERLHLDKIAFSAAKKTLEISEIRFDQPYGDILIADDGSVNLGRVKKEQGSEPGAEDDTKDATEEPLKVDRESALDITIGRVVIAKASADFADQSLPLPFVAKIADLNGDITTIATGSREPSTVELEGKVDEFGFVRVTGTVTPLEPKLDTDLHVAFQNVEMPKFSAYTIPFAGRVIASGKLDLDLGYQVKASELAGENTVILRDFELGEKVEHPGAMSLPLGLAVALLKDPDGKIDIDLPVRGNVDDPEFRYGSVILKALANLIVKIVGSPFALLGNLLGVEASELEYINFLQGRADLTPPEMERAAKLAEALALRPELVLEVSGVVDRKVDGAALQSAKLQLLVEERIAAMKPTEESMYAEQQTKVLEALFIEQGEVAIQRAALEQLKPRYTTLPAAAEGAKAEPQFDALAYTSEIRRQLTELQPITDTELAALANERAANTRAAILQADPAQDARIITGKAQAVESKPDESIRMKVTLTAGANE